MKIYALAVAVLGFPGFLGTAPQPPWPAAGAHATHSLAIDEIGLDPVISAEDRSLDERITAASKAATPTCLM